MSILDSMEYLESIDKNHMLKIQTSFPENCEDAIRRSEVLKIPRKLKISENSILYTKPKNILIAGMGGSAIGGEVLKDWLQYKINIPVEISRSYDLPAYCDEETLVLAVSYSGNTEETLSSFVDAIERSCMVVSISSGGHLSRFSTKLGVPLVRLPSNFPPRIAFPYLFFPLTVILRKMGVYQNEDSEIKNTIETLKSLRIKLAPEISTPDNLAKKLALEVQDRIPVIYGFGHYRSIALRMKTQFNENSKITALCDVFPELSHNAVVGWMGIEDLGKCFAVIFIRDSEEPIEIRSRIILTKKIALREIEKIFEIFAEGDSKLARMLSVLYVGDFASIYLALLRGIDPTPVEVIEEIKKELQKEVLTVDGLQQRIRKLKF